MSRKTTKIKIYRENHYGYNTFSMCLYFFLFKARRETMKSLNDYLTWKQFDLLFAIYVCEKSGEPATYESLLALFNARFEKGVHITTIKRWVKRLEKRNFAQVRHRVESIRTGGKKIPSWILTTVKGRQVMTTFQARLLDHSELVAEFKDGIVKADEN